MNIISKPLVSSIINPLVKGGSSAPVFGIHIASTGNKLSFIEGEQIELNAVITNPPADSIAWALNGIPTGDTVTPLIRTAALTDAGAWTCDATKGLDVVTSNTLNITVDELISLSIASDATDVESGTPVTLTATTNADSIEWFYSLDGAPDVSFSTDNPVTATPYLAGSYLVTAVATKGTQTATDTLTVNVTSALYVSFTYEPLVINILDDVTLTAETNGDTVDWSYSRDGLPFIPLGSGLVVVATPTHATDYTVRAVATLGVDTVTSEQTVTVGGSTDVQTIITDPLPSGTVQSGSDNVMTFIMTNLNESEVLAGRGKVKAMHPDVNAGAWTSVYPLVDPNVITSLGLGNYSVIFNDGWEYFNKAGTLIKLIFEYADGITEVHSLEQEVLFTNLSGDPIPDDELNILQDEYKAQKALIEKGAKI